MENVSVILGMVMLPEVELPNLEAFLADFESEHGRLPTEAKTGNETLVFKVGEETVAIAHMPVPVPADDLEATAQYAYNWIEAMEHLKHHRSHLIVSVLPGPGTAVARYRLYTELLCSLFRTVPSIGLYQGAQSLLIPADDYVLEASGMTEDLLPLNLWLYFGLGYENGLASGYTLGLQAFGKPELEIIGSRRSPEELRMFLFNIAHYMLDYDVVFTSGDTIGLSEDEKVTITHAEGALVQGDVYRLDY